MLVQHLGASQKLARGRCFAITGALGGTGIPNASIAPSSCGPKIANSYCQENLPVQFMMSAGV